MQHLCWIKVIPLLSPSPDLFSLGLDPGRYLLHPCNPTVWAPGAILHVQRGDPFPCMLGSHLRFLGIPRRLQESHLQRLVSPHQILGSHRYCLLSGKSWFLFVKWFRDLLWLLICKTNDPEFDVWDFMFHFWYSC